MSIQLHSVCWEQAYSLCGPIIVIAFLFIHNHHIVVIIAWPLPPLFWYWCNWAAIPKGKVESLWPASSNGLLQRTGSTLHSNHSHDGWSIFIYTRVCHFDLTNLMVFLSHRRMIVSTHSHQRKILYPQCIPFRRKRVVRTCASDVLEGMGHYGSHLRL